MGRLAAGAFIRETAVQNDRHVANHTARSCRSAVATAAVVLCLLSQAGLAAEDAKTRIQAMALQRSAAIDGRVLFLGDSITEGLWWKSLCTDWQVNGGISGAGVGEIDAYLDEILAATRPEVVLVLLGVNDARRPYLRNHSKEEWPAKYAAIVGKIAATGATPVLLTILPIEAAGRESPDFDPAVIRYYNGAIRSLAARSGYLAQDLYSALADASGYMPAGGTIDGVHLTRERYLAVLRHLLDAVKMALGRRGVPPAEAARLGAHC